VQRRHEHYEQFVHLMMTARGRLATVYASGAPPERMREDKRAAFAKVRDDYAKLKAQWGGDAWYDGWMAGELNNAKLLPFGLYHEWVGAFEAVFARNDGDWQAFYADVARIAESRPDERRRQLETLRGPRVSAAG
jgi:predicted aminopeptidase